MSAPQLVTRSFPGSRVRVVRTWHPAHARHYDVLGLALREEPDPVTGEPSVCVGVYGYLDTRETPTIGVAARRRETPRPIPARSSE